jgi:drug/metabolite transporter (DMT)-like permease
MVMTADEKNNSAMNAIDKKSNGEDGSDDGIEEDTFDGFTERDSLLPSTSPEEGKNHRRGHSAWSFFHGAPQKVASIRGHHRRKSSISKLLDSVSDGLMVIADDVATAADDVKNTFLHQVQEAHDGRNYFLDTAMTRSLSLRPEDLKNFYEQTTGNETPPAATMPMGPLLALLGAVVAISSHGTALSLQNGVAAPLKLFWRMSAVAMILALMALRTVIQDGVPRLNVGQWTTVMLAITCFVVQNLCFVTALSYTTIGNTVIFANSQAVLLLVAKVLTGSHVLWMEGLGALVASSGAIVCAMSDHNEERKEDNNSKALFGTLFALASALAGVGYLTFAKSARSIISVTVFTFLMMFGGSFLVLFSMILLGEEITWSRHLYHGLFGWINMRPDRIGVEIWIVLVCNLVGTMGFVRSMQYFDSIIIAVAILLEPVLASLIAYSMGVGRFPSIGGWIGNLLVAIGTLSVVYPSVNKGENSGH